MNFKINHIQIIFSDDAITFFIEGEEFLTVVCDCKKFKNREELTKKSFEVLYEILKGTIKSINKGSIFRPMLKIDPSYIGKEHYTKLHSQFFTELGLSLPVRNFNFIEP